MTIHAILGRRGTISFLLASNVLRARQICHNQRCMILRVAILHCLAVIRADQIYLCISGLILGPDLRQALRVLIDAKELSTWAK